MKPTLKVGETAEFAYQVPASKTVPHLYPEAHEFAMMPKVFATGFMVGLMEWTCMQLLEKHLDSGEGSLGTHIDVSHIAATVPGQTVTVKATCTKVEGRKMWFSVVAHDGLDKIGEGTHERFVIAWDKFEAIVNKKAKAARVSPLMRRKG